MPKLNDYILINLECTNNTGSIILFLEFLSKIEVRKLSFNDTDNIFQYNQVFWRLLRHQNEKVRVLAAKCFTLFHEFRLGIPKAIGNIITILFKISDENFVFGLLQTLIFMIKKYESDIRFIEANGRTILFGKIRELIRENISFPCRNISFYLKCKFLEFLIYLNFDLYDSLVVNIVFGKLITCREDVENTLENENISCHDLGYYHWNDYIKLLYCN